MATYSNSEIFASTSSVYTGVGNATYGSGTTKFSIHTAPTVGVSRATNNFSAAALTVTLNVVSVTSGVGGATVDFIANGVTIQSAAVSAGNSTTLTIPAGSTLVNGGELYINATQIGGPNSYVLSVTTSTGGIVFVDEKNLA